MLTTSCDSLSLAFRQTSLYHHLLLLLLILLLLLLYNVEDDVAGII
jgi:hypothetical protein